MNRRILTAAAIVLAIICSVLPVMGYGETIHNPGGEGSTAVELTIDAARLRIVAPTVLPVYVGVGGSTATATDGTAKIVNLSHAPVEIVGAEVKGKSGWSLQDYSSNLSKLGIGQKKLALSMTLGGKTFQTTGPNALNFQRGRDNLLLPGFSVGKDNNTLPISYTAKAAPQRTASTETKLVEVVFRAKWAE